MAVKTTIPPKEVLAEIRLRDTVCVYCHKEFDRAHLPDSRKDWDTIEHLNHRSDWDSVGDYIRDGKPVAEIVALCCHQCNSNRSNMALLDWFKTDYCRERNINYDTVSSVVRNYIDNYENFKPVR